MIQPLIASEPWSFGINDSSMIAWLIIIAYLTTAFLCWRARAGGQSPKEPRKRTLWTLLSLALIFLCLNKQLDLHVLCMDAVRDLDARDWQGYSTLLLCGIIVVVVGLCALWIGAKILREANGESRWALVFLLGFLGVEVLRFLPGPMSGLLETHLFTEEDGLLHIHLIELLELGSLVAIGLLARSCVRNHEDCLDNNQDDDQRSSHAVEPS